ncbi:MAG: hypothetical protein VKO21_12500 [Candidatus Sericytochromatia bacterium]|nr:hypothetical protein [Candidatus Sericytochromatia bacterium]
MWLTRWFKRRKPAQASGRGKGIVKPARSATGSLQRTPTGGLGGASRPAGLLEVGAVQLRGGGPLPVMIRRGRLEDAQAFARWPEPSWFDWVGLAQGRPSGRDVKGHVNFNEPSSLLVLEVLDAATADQPLLGGVALGVDRSGRIPVLEVRYLERLPGSDLKGVGKLLLAAALYEAARLEATLVLDALLKSGSDLFYRRCGMVEHGQSKDPGLTRRMAFPDEQRALRFLDECRREGLLP